LIYSEARLIPFGIAVGDKLAQNKSLATKEVVSELVHFPTGITLEDNTGRFTRCKSFYVSLILGVLDLFKIYQNYRRL